MVKKKKKYAHGGETKKDASGGGFLDKIPAGGLGLLGGVTLGDVGRKVGLLDPRIAVEDSEEENKKKLALMASSGGQKPVGMKKGGAVKRRRGDGIARRGRTRG